MTNVGHLPMLASVACCGAPAIAPAADPRAAVLAAGAAAVAVAALAALAAAAAAPAVASAALAALAAASLAAAHVAALVAGVAFVASAAALAAAAALVAAALLWLLAARCSLLVLVKVVASPWHSRCRAGCRASPDFTGLTQVYQPQSWPGPATQTRSLDVQVPWAKRTHQFAGKHSSD